MSKLYLLIRNSDTKRSWFKYFETEKEMDLYLRKIKYLKNLFVIEDSRDIVYN